MKIYKRMMSFLLILSLFSIATAQVELSGFADFQLVQPMVENSNPSFQNGQFEVGLSAGVTSSINFEGAIAYNPDTGGFEAGAAFIEATLNDKRGLGLVMGQFDVPFGLDWQHIAAPDRRLITSPLLNEKSVNGWNDFGVNLYGEFLGTTITTFVVNGASDGFAGGGRFGFPILDVLEIGASIFAQTSENNSGSRPRVLGGDFQTATGPFSTRTEVQYMEDFQDGDFEYINHIPAHRGFYSQADLDLDGMMHLPLIIVGRYGQWSTVNNNNQASRVTLGIVYSVSEVFEFRTEFLTDTVDDEDEYRHLVLQTVVSF